MRARIVPITLNAEGLAHIDEAAELLTRGGLVAFPTETVYGVGCNADDAGAVERLRQLKRRPPDKAFSIHIGRVEDVGRYVSHVPAIADKLIRRYWPGPLTLVLPAKDGDTVGLRMPSNQIALELLKRTPVPVFVPSANRSGEPPAKSAQEVADALADELDLILDGGATTLKEASTVLRVSGETWEILRKGSVTAEMVRRTLGKTIVFVCTANSCRSPMAEVLCKQMLADRLRCGLDRLEQHGYSVVSAGTAATWQMPASSQAVEAMRQWGLDLSRHESRPLTPGLIEDADVVFVMARHHADSIERIIPEAGAKIKLLDPSGDDVRDPVGGSVATFVACAEVIERHLRQVIDSL